MSSQIDDHDVLLRALRQERISAEASMDHILRASSSLEQLLRSTVTDLAQLKRDFDAGADGRNAVPRLQRMYVVVGSFAISVVLITGKLAIRIKLFRCA